MRYLVKTVILRDEEYTRKQLAQVYDACLPLCFLESNQKLAENLLLLSVAPVEKACLTKTV